jgi:hypothetical protein
MDINSPAHNFIEDSLVILTKQTLDIFLRQENPSELISLYTFYYYTAKWQRTNQPKCTTDYVSKGLHWNLKKVRRVKKQLIEFGLIEDARIVDPKTKRVKGYYVKINYIFKKKALKKTGIQKKQGSKKCTPHDFKNGKNTNLSAKARGAKTDRKKTKARGAKSHRVEQGAPNALSTNNKNALSANKYIYSSLGTELPRTEITVYGKIDTKYNKYIGYEDVADKEKTQNKKEQNKQLGNTLLTAEFQEIWALYPNKKGKAAALIAYQKARKSGVTFDEIKKGVENYRCEIRAKGTAPQFIKHGSTWFRGQCWLDEYDFRDKEGCHGGYYDYSKLKDPLEEEGGDEGEIPAWCAHTYI